MAIGSLTEPRKREHISRVRGLTSDREVLAPTSHRFTEESNTRCMLVHLWPQTEVRGKRWLSTSLMPLETTSRGSKRQRAAPDIIVRVMTGQFDNATNAERAFRSLSREHFEEHNLRVVANEPSKIRGRGDRTRRPNNVKALRSNRLRKQQFRCQEIVRKLVTQTGLI